MEWHQAWLLMLDEHELMHLHDDCRTRAKANYHAQRFGLAKAWDGLAHEVLERARELAQQSELRNDQLSLVDLEATEGAYGHHRKALMDRVNAAAAAAFDLDPGDLDGTDAC